MTFLSCSCTFAETRFRLQKSRSPDRAGSSRTFQNCGSQFEIVTFIDISEQVRAEERPQP